MINDIVTQLTNKITREYDQLIERIFLECGFTKEYLFKHAEEFQWTIYQDFPDHKIMAYKGEPIFMIYESSNREVVMSDGNYKYITEWRYTILNKLGPEVAKED